MNKYLIILLLFSTAAGGQIDSLFLTDEEKIEKNRYKDIKESPYLFDGWMLGTVMGIGGHRYKQIPINYNGYTKEFEVKRGDDIIKLDNKAYMRIEINPELNEGIEKKYIFQRGFHNKFEEQFAELLYVGDNFLTIRTFDVTLNTNTVQDVGKTVEFKRFYPQFFVFMIRDDELTTLRLKEKPILKQLGFKKDLQQFISENQTDFTKEADLIKFLAYYDLLLSGS